MGKKRKTRVFSMVLGIALTMMPFQVQGAIRSSPGENTVSRTESLFSNKEEYFYADSLLQETDTASFDREVKALNSTAKLKGFMLLDSNKGLNDYIGNWSRLTHSYLLEEDNGLYLRVQYAEGEVYIERYQKDFTLHSHLNLAQELPKFGGFHDDGSNYYLVFGQDNPKESNSCEVLRIVKYSHDWQKLGTASVYGSNTYTPFFAGTLRMDSHKGNLYLRLAREMYKSSDGYHHQSCMTVKIQTSDMTVADIASSIQDNTAGYVSHSFNQFIRVDEDGTLIALDHGDAYPRAAVLSKYTGSKLGTWGTVSTIHTLTYAGSRGQNYTNATVGGLEISNTAYLTVGSSGVQEGSTSQGSRNIYLTATPKGTFTQDATRFTWITNYTGSVTSCSNPQLVEINKDRYLLLWMEKNYNNQGKLRYVFVSGSGGLISEIYTADGQLSDCQPIYDGSRVVWYVSDGEDLTFYTITETGNLNKQRAVSPALFEDIPVHLGNWRFESSRYVAFRGLMNGVGGSSLFMPDSPLTRAMFATVLYRMAGEPTMNYYAAFSDVEAGKWYTNAILWANQKGIVSGFQDGRYGINENITREQIAKMLYLFGNTQGYSMSGSASLDHFTDLSRVNIWAFGYLQWAVEAGIINGKPNDGGGYRLDPSGEATRIECAAMLMRFQNKYQ
ncbi:MAG: S-layer homology domain-containing protein [Lachnospiraceae bacterium]|nr:S-layer homology domain-containing protein [Lachnospiraceae bacterium]